MYMVLLAEFGEKGERQENRPDPHRRDMQRFSGRQVHQIVVISK
jgi:hypothetical protein